MVAGTVRTLFESGNPQWGTRVMNEHAKTIDNGPVIDDVDRRIIAATQRGLPLTERPYDVVADRRAFRRQRSWNVYGVWW